MPQRRRFGDSSRDMIRLALDMALSMRRHRLEVSSTMRRPRQAPVCDATARLRRQVRDEACLALGGGGSNNAWSSIGPARSALEATPNMRRHRQAQVGAAAQLRGQFRDEACPETTPKMRHPRQAPVFDAAARPQGAVSRPRMRSRVAEDCGAPNEVLGGFEAAAPTGGRNWRATQ